MARDGSAAGEAERQVEQAAEQASPWIERFARVGYVANGIVYLVVGVLALQAAFGSGGKTTGQEGALRSILFAPMGRVLLSIVTLGLIGYALWRLIQAAADPENEGAGAKGIAVRAGHATGGLLYAFLAFAAARLVLGSGGGGGSPDDWTARLLAYQPVGRWLVVGAGAVIAGFGAYQVYKACKAGFREDLKLGEMSRQERIWATRIGRFGHAARGVVFGIIGVFLVQAALQTEPEKARGLGGALQTLARQPFGPYILGTVALGLIAYGVYIFVEARYRRIDPARLG